MVLDSPIPKIIHQVWIGKKPHPTKFMNTWRDKHVPLGWEYRLWNEAEIVHNVDIGRYAQRVNSIEEINGKADVFRWIILQKFGGVFVDADSICIEPIDEHLLNGVDAFAGWEQEQIRTGLVATGTMGFTPNHPIVNSALEWIAINPISRRMTGKRAWSTVGPGLLTHICQMYEFKNITMYPSHYFLPFHYTGIKYVGHDKVYAYQEWGSTKQNYDAMNQVELPAEFNKPEASCSILISSYNTKSQYLVDCLASIKAQLGRFNIEVVWINDGSTDECTASLKSILKQFKETTRWTDVVFDENCGNKGIGYSLNKGVQMCSHENIIKMDSDDIMVEGRIAKQLNYMHEHPDCMICGAQVSMFKNNSIKNVAMKTTHPSITWQEYVASPKDWFINHPTVCYRKSAIIAAGNYGVIDGHLIQDFHLELKMLKTHGKIHNMPDVLLHYRLHPGQVTNTAGDPKWKIKRQEIIADMLAKTS